MLRRLIAVIALVAGICTTALVLAAPALAKGPSAARITGPGLARAIVTSGQGEPGQAGTLSNLAAQTGLFTVMFGTNATVPWRPRLLRIPPQQASLGPRYTVTYTVPGVTPRPGEQYGRVRQYLYPRAAGGPVIYTPPGQHGFGRPLMVTGWLRASPHLLRTLARLGVPARPGAATDVSPAARPAAARPSGSGGFPWLIASAAAIGAIALAGVALRLRRRGPTAQRATGH